MELSANFVSAFAQLPTEHSHCHTIVQRSVISIYLDFGQFGNRSYGAVYNGERPGPVSIRVLSLQPTSSLEPSAIEDTIICTTKVQSLDDKSNFTTLSYCWGTSRSNHTMVCNGVVMSIMESLDRALRWFRQNVADNFRNDSYTAKTTFLIMCTDAVCINQTDIDERNPKFY